MISAYAPAGLEILGNHTDYNEGIAISAALQFGVSVEGDARTDNQIGLLLEPTGESENFGVQNLSKSVQYGWVNEIKGVLQQLQKYGIPFQGFDLRIQHNVPKYFDFIAEGTLGLATVLFLQKLFPFNAQPSMLAKLVHDAQVGLGKTYASLLGPMASVFARQDSVAVIDFRNLEANLIRFPDAYRFVICDGGARNLLLNAKMKIRRNQCEEAIRTIKGRSPEVKALRDVNPYEIQQVAGLFNEYVFRTVMHVCGEIRMVRESVEALQQGDVSVLAQNMRHSHESSRRSMENSTTGLDRVVEAAGRMPGVLGSRLTGYGFGGPTLHLVEAAQAETFIQALAAERLGEGHVAQLSNGAA
ncbi:MAG: hypothetical protein JO317_04820 [Verrucomicrobiae bacterium]|nr:hypothetical protein [Verrucomicrobiae bacterium]